MIFDFKVGLGLNDPMQYLIGLKDIRETIYIF